MRTIWLLAIAQSPMIVLMLASLAVGLAYRTRYPVCLPRDLIQKYRTGQIV